MTSARENATLRSRSDRNTTQKVLLALVAIVTLGLAASTLGLGAEETGIAPLEPGLYAINATAALRGRDTALVAIEPGDLVVYDVVDRDGDVDSRRFVVGPDRALPF